MSEQGLLFQPLRMGNVTVPNRIMQTAHSKQYSDRAESERETAYYVRRAQGGCGLFMAGNHFVHPSGSVRNFEDAWRSESITANRRFTDAIHDAGSRVMVQLNHHGAQAQLEGPAGPRPVFAPSRLISPSTGIATKEADEADIRSFVEGWAQSAEFALEAGFDGVEIHMAHGYLLHQFLSPLYNVRSDGYGGDLEGRTRFPREVLRAVRERVGDDATVGIRIVANEFHPGGLDAAQLRDVVAALRAEARIDFLDLAAGGYHNVHYVFPSSPMPVAWLRDETAAMKQANPDIAVFGVGATHRVEDAEEVLRSGVADMVALTRAQIADPDLSEKLRTGRTDEIRHCIRLNQGCLGRGTKGLPVSCTVNPLAGRELERAALGRAGAAEDWVVVGGGPAGMRAAVELAGLGHRVRLFERAERLGGQLELARAVPGRASVGLLVDDLLRDLARAGVEVSLGTALDAAAIEALGADGVVIATGAVAPAGAGVELGGAYLGGFPASGIVDAFTALADPAALGRRVVVVDSDGTAYASGVVLALLAEGIEVEYLTPAETIFAHVGAGYERPLLLERLAAHPGFRRRTSVLVEAIAGSEVTLVDALTRERAVLDGVDAVVALEPRETVRPVGLGTVEGVGMGRARMIAIGDAVSARTIDSAIADAVELAYQVAVPEGAAV